MYFIAIRKRPPISKSNADVSPEQPPTGPKNKLVSTLFELNWFRTT